MNFVSTTGAYEINAQVFNECVQFNVNTYARYEPYAYIFVAGIGYDWNK